MNNLTEVSRLHKLWTEDNPNGRPADLSNASLHGTNLSYADLGYANLSNANLSSENLRYAYLRYANLGGADLSNASLHGANLSYADLGYANLHYAYLRCANLSNADLRNADLRYAYLRYANLRNADLSNADFRGADLRGANLSNADLSNADLRNANLSDANLRGVRWGDLSGVPVIENIHQVVYRAASQDGALNMGDWHTCETTHCRAGWVVTLAGDKGRELEAEKGTHVAALMIYTASDPEYIKRIGQPDFFATNEDALEDMKHLAGA